MKTFYAVLIFCLAHQLGGAQTPSALRQTDEPTQMNRGGSVPLKVVGQVLFGTVGGITGAVLTKANPVLGGVGWTLGSAFGVYAIGNVGTRSGSYWWTLAAGGATMLAWTPAMVNNQHSGINQAVVIGAAAITSLAAEIIVYHLTKDEGAAQVSFTVSPMGSGYCCNLRVAM